MKKRKAAIYDPYLDTLGGGEKHVLSILKVLENEGFDVSIFWNKNLEYEIENRFAFKFKSLRFQNNVFAKGIQPLQKLKALQELDVFIYVTDGSYFFSSAKKNFVFVMVPNRKLFNPGLANRIKLFNWRFIANSQFTSNFLMQWGLDTKVLYPYIDKVFLNTPRKGNKEKVILTVGRFFTHLHAKKHDLIISLFKKHKAKFPDFKLVLAGGLRNEDKKYFTSLEKLAGNDTAIQLKPNVSYRELLELYDKSLIYWHFAGFGIDEQAHPELVEHFGITPLEAMSRGCMTFVYNAGGPKEIIQDKKSGFLFNTEEELIAGTEQVIKDRIIQKKVSQNAALYVKERFSYETFRETVSKIIL